MFDRGHLVFSRWPKINSVRISGGLISYSKLKSIGETVLKISHSLGVYNSIYIAFILKSLIAAILFLADGLKSIVSVFLVV